MVYISKELRDQVTQRAQGRCEYCQCDQMNGIYMEVDHITPVIAGGATSINNLCLSCRGCNAFKRDFQTGIDPDSGKEVSLYDPRTQIWSEHFRWSEDGVLMIALTPTGRATINRLKLNRDFLTIARRRWVSVGWHPPK
jgi:hypothetical protein